MGLLGLFLTASMPVLNVLLLTAVGSISATSRVNILNQEARKHLNNVVYYVFNPSLVSSNLSQTITLESMVLLWFMPVSLVLNFVIGSALGWIVIQVTSSPPHLRGVILASCSAGNIGNLLIILVPAMCKEKGSPLGSPDVCDTYGMAYASLSLAIGTILQWSYVYNLVRISSPYKEENVSAKLSKMDFQEESRCLLPQSCMAKEISNSNCLLYTQCLNEPASPLEPYGGNDKKVPRLDDRKTLLRRLSRIIDIKKLFAPASIGVIIGLIIGSVPQIKRWIIGQGAPLRVIQDSATLLGNGTIPCIHLITGGNLTKGLQGPTIKFSIILGVMIVRYIALPLIGIFIVQWAVHLGLVHSDPLYHFILLLQYAVPPAMNITSMVQMFEVGQGELSVIFLWTYVMASVALTLWSTLFLWIVS
ncbi:protein PIN-LIKES 3-like isoform X1 [Asparagus officinalis]|uniref:protein PIN-LIKES 3-like isoform X1 n=1 Tax=Asparagus officinalis TaxID=4686 RepID=UPI00098E4ACE|nr:protein PIN-LIKES 3-like isoform X1 [Asparagus officinalis]XP_020271060.1 protein PIN-LIKES 3-like isoform X1 [Asparagus officinalis]XP_020271066.1 protein PIN-LIKES 3-like isoform X1 [Asparagus officinalis]XP_020271072.1 protein PIN-LIKES 3-like isoform X1 [Asparagus officinalis]